MGCGVCRQGIGQLLLRCLNSGIHALACPGDKLADIPAGHPAGFPSPTRRAIGAPGRAARSQRALFRRARSRTGAGAKPQQATLCCGFCFSASSPSAGQDGPLLYRGPLRGGETGSTGRAAGESMDGLAFSSGHDARSKSPAPTHGLAGHDARQAPSGGVVFSWLLLFWTSKREVTRAPQAHESSCL